MQISTSYGTPLDGHAAGGFARAVAHPRASRRFGVPFVATRHGSGHGTA